MNVWLIEPRDPLIVRDGRPFGPTPGARATSLAFPFPSTITGGIRTRDGLDDNGRFQTSEIERVKKISVRGPLLVDLDQTTGDIAEWLAPAPADALLLAAEQSVSAVRRLLVPLRLSDQANTNLPSDLALVGMAKPDPRKPHTKAPHYWYWSRYLQWLEQPQEGVVTFVDLGHNGPTMEERTHVSIQQASQTAAEGALFQTRGLEFTCKERRARLAIAVATDAPRIKAGLSSLGGERRMVCWRRSGKGLPACPSSLRESIIRHRHCRLILLTPAHFLHGSMPMWVTRHREGVTPELAAIAIGRPRVISGWSFESTPQKPKPTRRLAPAGTVLFLRLEGSEQGIRQWIEATWMHCVSDDGQDRADGFGLAALGTWDGTLQAMEVSP